MEDQTGQPVGAADLVKLVHLVRQALWGEGERPEIRVEGVDADGLMQIAIIGPDVTYRVRAPDVSALAALAGPRQQPSRELGRDKLPYAPRTAPALGEREVPVNGEPAFAVLGGAEAQEVSTIHVYRGRTFAAACFTTRGPTQKGQGMEYKPFNEDAVVIGGHAPASGGIEICSVGAFDQAGGEGAVADAHGAASGAAARAFHAAVLQIHGGADPIETLRHATGKAGDAVRAFGVGAMTTFAGVVLVAKGEGDGRTREAFVATVGDSRAILFDRQGRVKQKTTLHNLGSAITSGVVKDIPVELALQFAGVLMRGVGGEDDAPDIAHWTVEPGDRIVVETDGLGDARELEAMPQGVWHADRCAEDQGRILAHVAGAAEAVKVLVGYALDQMADQYGKPDNIGVAVADVL